MPIVNPVFEKGMSEPMVGEGVKFERIRRITGYLVPSLYRFNHAKTCEERDRVKHLDVTLARAEDKAS